MALMTARSGAVRCRASSRATVVAPAAPTFAAPRIAGVRRPCASRLPLRAMAAAATPGGPSPNYSTPGSPSPLSGSPTPGTPSGADYPINPLSGNVTSGPGSGSTASGLPPRPPSPPGGRGGGGGSGGGGGDQGPRLPPPPGGFTWNQLILAGLTAGIAAGMTSPIGAWFRDRFTSTGERVATTVDHSARDVAGTVADRTGQATQAAAGAGRAAADYTSGAGKSATQSVVGAGKAAVDTVAGAGKSVVDAAKHTGKGAADAVTGAGKSARDAAERTGKGAAEAGRETFVDKPREVASKADTDIVQPAKAKGGEFLSSVGRALHIVPEETSRVVAAVETKTDQVVDKAKKVGSDVKEWADEKEWYKRWQVYAWSGVALGLGVWGATVAFQDQVNKNKGKPGSGAGQGADKDVKVTVSKGKEKKADLVPAEKGKTGPADSPQKSTIAAHRPEGGGVPQVPVL